MTSQSLRAENSIWVVACTLIAFASVYAFLQDMIDPKWPAWVLTPLIVLGFRVAISRTRDDSLARAALYQGALVLVPFMGVYGLMDVAFKADWPAWVVAPAVVLALWTGISTIVSVEAD
ncbi:MAG TPA: hypothetical protein VGD23_04335 [Sphingomicrobium sp.]